MGERRVVVDNLVLSYEGLFDIRELYLLIDKWLRQKSYDKFEKRNYEHERKDGTYIEIELEPWKKITDYTKLNINIYIHCFNLKEVIVKKDNLDVKMNQGKVKIRLIGYLITDFDDKWEYKSKFYFQFFRVLVDRYIYKGMTKKYEFAIAEDVRHLYNNLEAFLNLYRV